METPENSPNIVALHVVDYGAQGEYDIFGKVVCKSDVRDFPPAALAEEKENLRFCFGSHVSILEVEEIPAVRS